MLITIMFQWIKALKSNEILTKWITETILFEMIQFWTLYR